MDKRGYEIMSGDTLAAVGEHHTLTESTVLQKLNMKVKSQTIVDLVMGRYRLLHSKSSQN